MRKHKFRNLAVAGAVAVGVVAAIAQTAPAARADSPAGTYTLVATGSDTIQDVYNQFASDINGASPHTLNSYNALDPTTGAAGGTLSYTDGTSGTACSYPRPNGSTQGLDALEASIGGPVGGGGVTPAPAVGCVDLARSSAGPNAAGSGPAGGSYTGTNPMQFVPFALDAVTGVVGPTAGTSGVGVQFTAQSHDAAGDTHAATTVATTLPAAVNSFSVQNLKDLFGSGIATTVTVSGVSTVFWPANGSVAQPTGSTKIDLYIPQLGSGTEKFWATTTGFAAATPPAWDHTTIINGALTPANDGGITFTNEEHDGTNVATDPIGYAPFSIAQWIAQSNNISGNTDRRHSAVLQDINGVAPTVTQLGKTLLNSAFPVTRLVYSVVQKSRFDNVNDPLHALLFGTTSKVCSSTAITTFGFATLKGASTLNATCGEEVAALTAAP
jgi:hypothetical protein